MARMKSIVVTIGDAEAVLSSRVRSRLKFTFFPRGAITTIESTLLTQHRFAVTTSRRPNRSLMCITGR